MGAGRVLLPGLPARQAGSLLTVAEALGRLLANVAPLPSERLPLEGCLGRALAAPLRAERRLPAFTGSAMDGYAVRSADLARATSARPIDLPVAFEIAAGGAEPRALGPGETARIFTGAPLPPGADAVVMQELVRLDCSGLAASARRPTEPSFSAGAGVASFERPCPAGENVRPAGEDLGLGELALPAGTTLGSAELGLAAALGAQSLEVHRRPKVSLLTTGDELCEPGAALPFSGIFDSNGPALSAAVLEAGAELAHRERVPDDAAAIRRALERGVGADLLLTVAGVSVGDRDLVRTALAELGVALDFWRVAMRPGKPVALGRWPVRGTPVLGLPGNPVSAWVTFELFARPLLRRLGGHRGPDRFFVEARLTTPVQKPSQLALYCRGRFADGAFTPAARQGSGHLTSIARQDSLAELPIGPERFESGALVRVRLLGRPQGGTP